MSTYDDYRQKMLKLAAIKNTIVRFRVLIISVLVAILAIVFTLLGIKGTVTKNLVLKTSDLTYGEALEIVTPAKAIMSGVSYEYAPEGSGAWQGTAPTRPGNYRVRAVTKGGFGTRHGKSVGFTISPRETMLTIGDKAVVYGNNPARIEAALASGDRLVKEELVFEYADYAAETTEVTVDPASVKIVNAQGEDVTACYRFEPPQTEVRFEKRSITVRPQDDAQTYCGAPIACDSLPSAQTVADLANGDTIAFETELYDAAGTLLEHAPEKAGDYTVKVVPSSVSVRHGDVDVTSHYDFSIFKDATFTVKKKVVHVTTATQTRAYNGLPLSDADFTCAEEGELPVGHTLSRTSALQEITDAGNVKNDATFAVTCDGTDVTENYDILVTAGTLTVTPLAIIVRTGSLDEVYKGSAYFTEEFTVDGTVLDDHTVVWTSAAPRITDAGTRRNDGSFAVVYKDNPSVAVPVQNYVITVDAGTLTVKRRAVTVVTQTQTFVYNGQPQYTYDAAVDESGTSLVSGHRLQAIEATATKVTDVCENEENHTAFDVTDEYGTVVTDNYEIGYRYGLLSVTAADLTLRPQIGSGSVVYDGERHAYENGYEIVTGDVYSPLVLKAYFTGTTEGGETLLLADRHEEVTEAGEYTLVFDEAYVAEHNPNYTVAVESGAFTVTTFAVTVTTGSGSKQYDGKPFKAGDAGVSNPSPSVMLPNGHHLEVVAESVAYSFENVTDTAGASANNVHTCIVKNADGADATANFDIDYNYGTLTITPREVAVSIASDTKPYDGTPLSKKEFTITSGSAADGESLAFADGESLLSIVYVGTLVNDYEIVPVGSSADNYALTVTAGLLEITKCQITVTTGSGTKPYDGNGFNALSAGVDAPTATLPDNHSLQIDESSVTVTVRHVTDTQTPNNNVHACFVKNGDGDDVTVNFEIAYVYGTLKITPRAATITPNTASEITDGKQEYDGDPYGARFSYIADGVVDGDTVDYILLIDGTLADNSTVANLASVTEAGTYTVRFDEAYLAANNTDYAFTAQTASFAILQREIEITTGSSAQEYTGAPWKVLTYTITRGSLATGHELRNDPNHTASFTTVADTKDKTGNNTTQYQVVFGRDGNGNADTTVSRNYHISYVFGTCTILPRNIIVTAHNVEVRFDGETHVAPRTATAVHAVEQGGDWVVDPSEESSFGLYGTHTLQGQGDDITARNVRDSRAFAYATYRVLLDETDMSENYKIVKTVEGTLTITPLSLHVGPQPAEKEYDGKAFVYPVEENNFQEGPKFAEGDTLTITAVSYIDDSTDEVVASPTNASVYKMTVEEYTGGGGFIADNYTLSWFSTFLTITPRTVTVTPYMASDTVEYNGETYTYGGLFRDDGRIIEADRAGISFAGYGYFTLSDGVQADSVTNANVYAIGLNEEALRRTYENYYFEDSGNGKFEITRRPITVTPYVTGDGIVLSGDAYFKEYDGVPLTADNFGYTSVYTKADGTTENGFVGSDGIVVTYWGVLYGDNAESTIQQPHAGAYVVHIYDDGKSGGVQNYIITRETCVLAIEPRHVLLTATVTGDGVSLSDDKYTKTYDGISPDWGYKAEHFTVNEAGEKVYDSAAAFVLDDEALYTPSFAVSSGKAGKTVPHADEYTVSIKLSSDIPNWESNYTFEFEPCTLTITPRTVTIVPRADSKVYDGDPYAYDTTTEGNFAYAAGSLPFVEYESESLVPIAVTAVAYFDESGNPLSASPFHAGTYKMKISSCALVADGSTIYASDYNIIYDTESVALTIGKRAVIIIAFVVDQDGTPMPNNTKTYDRNGVTPGCRAVFADDESKSGFVKGDELNNGFTPWYDITGKNGNRLPDADEYTLSVTSYALSDAVKADYTISACRDCTFTILPREVTVTPLRSNETYSGNPYEYEGAYRVESGNIFAEDKATFERALSATFTGTTAGGETVTNAPTVTEAGTYTIVLGSVHLTNYNVTDSRAGTFEIEKKALLVKTLDYKKTYDGKPLYAHKETYTAEEVLLDGTLVAGHRFATLEAEATNITHVSESETPNTTPYRIYDGEDIERTHDYAITYSEEEAHIGKLVIERRGVGVVLTLLEEEYDGQPHNGMPASGVCYAVRTGSVVEGETLVLTPVFTGTSYTGVTVDSEQSVTEAGEYRVRLRSARLPADNPDYTVGLAGEGTYTLKKRAVTVTTATNTFVYNGEEHKDVTCEKVNFLSGYELRALTDTAVKNVLYDGDTVVGTDNVVTYAVYRGDTDVSLNFALTVEYGTLTVTPRPLTVTTPSGIFEYDGEAHTKSTLRENDIVGLVETHRAELGGFAEITNAGDTPNTVETLVIYDGDGNDVTSNYAVSVTEGTLAVLPRTVKIVTGSKTFTYNGGEQQYTDYQTAARADGKPVLVSGHELVLKKTCTVKDAGVYDNANEYEVQNILDHSVVKDNYTIEYEKGTLTVEKASVRIRPVTPTASVLYSGSAWTTADYSLSGTVYDPLQLRLAFEGTLADGTLVSAFDGVTDAGTYTVGYDADYLKENNPNYEIAFDTSALTIARRSITVTTATDEKTYDGTPLSAPTATAGGDGLATGDAFVPTGTIVSVTDYTEAPVSNKTAFVIKHGDVDVTHNYVVSSFAYGTLTVTKRDILITPNGQTWEYDGETHCNKTADGNGIAPTDRLVAIDGTVTEVGEELNETGIVNATKFDIYRGDVVATGNYNVSYAEGGKLIITTRKVTLKPKDKKIAYDGATHTFDQTQYEVKNGSFLTGDTPTFAAYFGGVLYNGTAVVREQTVIDAAPYTLTFEACTVGANDKYYTFTFEPGSYEITRRTIAVRPKRLEKTYDGTFIEIKHGEDDYDVIKNTLAAGDRYKITDITSYWDAKNGKPSENNIYIRSGCVYNDGRGVDVSHNYIIYTEYQEEVADTLKLSRSDFRSKITVQQIKITVHPIAPREQNYYYMDVPQAVLPSGATDAEWQGLFQVRNPSVLCSGHEVRVNRAQTVFRGYGETDRWLSVDVYDGDGNKVTGGYDIDYDSSMPDGSESDSYITILPAELTISGNATDGYTVTLQGKGELSLEAEKGYKLYSVHYLWINEDGTYDVVRYDSRGNKRIEDRAKYERYYAITVM